jgi:hypothetical protein
LDSTLEVDSWNVRMAASASFGDVRALRFPRPTGAAASTAGEAAGAAGAGAGVAGAADAAAGAAGAAGVATGAADAAEAATDAGGAAGAGAAGAGGSGGSPSKSRSAFFSKGCQPKGRTPPRPPPPRGCRAAP